MGDNKVEDCASLSWLQPLIKAVQRVITLRLECSYSLSLSFLNIRTQPEIKGLFSNLKDVTVKMGTGEVVELFLKLDNPLTKLELYDVVDMETKDFQYFEQLLRKYSQPLKTLLFIISKNLVRLLQLSLAFRHLLSFRN